jgi:putative tricarboxylic transport membrane protein
MIRNSKDFWSGLIYIFIGSSAIIIARDYGMGTALRMGPAYFPAILGGLLFLIGAISVIRAFLVKGPPIGAFAFKGILAVIGATILFGLIVREAGLAIALPLLAIVSALGSTRFRWLPTLAMAAGLTVFSIYVFIKGLGIPLPILGSWFGG